MSHLPRISGRECIMVKNGLPPIHPGEFLRETLGELGVSQAQFARAVGVSRMRISHVVRGTRSVTAELALLFGRALGQSPQYWLNLQAAYDLKTAEHSLGKQLRAVAEFARPSLLGPAKCFSSAAGVAIPQCFREGCFEIGLR